MVYPGKKKKSYETPRHPWQETRIKEEKEMAEKYGLKNRREIWKAKSKLRKYRREARKLLAEISGSKEIDAHIQRRINDILGSLKRKGILKEDGDIEDILSLKTEDILERRLETQVYRKGLARSMKQARQFIVHGHIQVGGRRVTVPGYLVEKDEDIGYYPGSPLNNELHPMRGE
ncbi:MAG: 30S ribosomal protein S4 [Candidatus Syntropharchaeia archaeon]